MTSKVGQDAPQRTQLRWACPLRCEGGFQTVPQTNEHLKKCHLQPKKGGSKAASQLSITDEQMTRVHETTKKHRMEHDVVKMKNIHRVFSPSILPRSTTSSPTTSSSSSSSSTSPSRRYNRNDTKNNTLQPNNPAFQSLAPSDHDDLEVYAATRDELRRMAIACSTHRPGTESVLSTFQRLACQDVPWFNDKSAEVQCHMMGEACQLFEHFVRALCITGVLLPEDEGEEEENREGRNGNGGGMVAGGSYQDPSSSFRSSSNSSAGGEGGGMGGSGISGSDMTALQGSNGMRGGVSSSVGLGRGVGMNGGPLGREGGTSTIGEGSLNGYSLTTGTSALDDTMDLQGMNPYPEDVVGNWGGGYMDANGNEVYMTDGTMGGVDPMDGMFDQAGGGGVTHFNTNTAAQIWEPQQLNNKEGYRGAVDIEEDLYRYATDENMGTR